MQIADTYHVSLDDLQVLVRDLPAQEHHNRMPCNEFVWIFPEIFEFQSALTSSSYKRHERTRDYEICQMIVYLNTLDMGN